MKNKNNTKMETNIKHGNFTIKHFSHHNSWSLLYKDRIIWEGELYELFYDEFRFYIFEIESDPNKAAEFVVELYNWLDTQEEAFEKLLDSVYGEEKQSKDTKK